MSDKVTKPAPISQQRGLTMPKPSPQSSGSNQSSTQSNQGSNGASTNSK